MNLIEEIKKAVKTQKMLNAIEPDRVNEHTARVLWGNAFLRLRRSVNPRLRSDIRSSYGSEALSLTTRAVYQTVELAKHRREH